MSELLENPLLELGPRIAIIDDRDEDALPIEKAFGDLKVGSKYFNVDFAEPRYPHHPLKDVEIVFLDLHYDEGFGASFDPYSCVKWLTHVVPEGQKYILIVWSRDPGLTEQLIEVMVRLKVTMPYFIDTKPKQRYRIGDNEYDVEKLLDELGISLKYFEIEVLDYYGKVVEIEEDAVLINCLINEEPKIFEIRRFDLQPFKKYMDLKTGAFLRIRITTKPGSRIIEFIPDVNDLSDKFVKPDDPEDFGNTDWLNSPES